MRAGSASISAFSNASTAARGSGSLLLLDDDDDDMVQPPRTQRPSATTAPVTDRRL